MVTGRRQWRPTPVLLPGKSYGWRSLVGYQESDTTERLHFHFSLSCIGEGNGNPLQCSCLKNPRDRGAWWAAVYGLAQSRTRLKRLSSSRDGNRVWKELANLLLKMPSTGVLTESKKANGKFRQNFLQLENFRMESHLSARLYWHSWVWRELLPNCWNQTIPAEKKICRSQNLTIHYSSVCT